MKNYVLDTTILLYDAQALFAFEENNVIIPISVIEDIDRFKKDVSETGRNARQTSRYLDSLRRGGSLISGVDLESGGKLFVGTALEESTRRLQKVFPEQTRDFRMLATALAVTDSSDLPTILVTKDVYLRIKADALNLIAQDYESDKVDIEELYSGATKMTVASEVLDQFNTAGEVEIDGTLFPNQYVVFSDASDATRHSLGRFDKERNKVVRLIPGGKETGWRIQSRNNEQAFVLDALLNDSVQLVTLLGMAGTGKTLLAVAAAIYKTVDENVFNRVLVSRPTLPMGQDIGYLPGTVEEKLTPWMYPIADNVELLMRGEGRTRRPLRGFTELVDMGILVIEPLTYIRGRSIHNQYLIVDEAQNLTPHEIKTIITRVGEGTKVVLTGDPYQIDNPYIDSSSNGLSFVVERFKKHAIAAHVTLKQGERSPLSDLAAKLL